MSEVVNARFPEDLMRKLDLFVLRGRHKSRSEALRSLVERFFMEHPELFITDRLRRLLKGGPRLSDGELEKIGEKLFYKPVAELVAEGRGR